MNKSARVSSDRISKINCVVCRLTAFFLRFYRWQSQKNEWEQTKFNILNKVSSWFPSRLTVSLSPFSVCLPSYSELFKSLLSSMFLFSLPSKLILQIFAVPKYERFVLVSAEIQTPRSIAIESEIFNLILDGATHDWDQKRLFSILSAANWNCECSNESWMGCCSMCRVGKQSSSISRSCINSKWSIGMLGHNKTCLHLFWCEQKKKTQTNTISWCWFRVAAEKCEIGKMGKCDQQIISLSNFSKRLYSIEVVCAGHRSPDTTNYCGFGSFLIDK